MKMKFILLTLLFLIDILYFINSEDKMLSDQKFMLHTEVKKYEIGDNFKHINKHIDYNINLSFDEKEIAEALKNLKEKTCLIFNFKTHDITSETLLFREGQDCGADLIEENNQLFFGVFVNKNCNSASFIAKITLKAITMKNTLVNLIKESKSNNENDQNIGNDQDKENDPNNGTYQNYANYPNYVNHQNNKNDQINAEDQETINELKISPGKRCKYAAVTNTLIIYTNSLHSPSDHKDYNFFLKSRQLRNSFEKIVFEDLKFFSENFCKDSCIGKNSTCKNGGFLNPSNCYFCICSMYWTDHICSYTRGRGGRKTLYLFEATTGNKQGYLTLSEPFFIKIEGPPNTRMRLQILLEKNTFISCSTISPFEIRMQNGKNEDRIYPCGSFQEFSFFTENNYIFLFVGKHKEIKQLEIIYQAIRL